MGAHNLQANVYNLMRYFAADVYLRLTLNSRVIVDGEGHDSDWVRVVHCDEVRSTRRQLQHCSVVKLHRLVGKEDIEGSAQIGEQVRYALAGDTKLHNRCDDVSAGGRPEERVSVEHNSLKTDEIQNFYL